MVSRVVSTLVKQKGSWRVSQDRRLPCSPFTFFDMNPTLDTDTSESVSKMGQGRSGGPEANWHSTAYNPAAEFFYSYF